MVAVKMEEDQEEQDMMVTSNDKDDDSELKLADDNPSHELAIEDDDDKMTAIDVVANQLGTNDDIKSVDTEVIDDDKVVAIDDVANQLNTEVVDEKITGVDDVANQLGTESVEERITGNDDVENQQLDREVVEEKETSIDDVATQMDTEMDVTGTDDVANQQLETVGTKEDLKSVDTVEVIEEEKGTGVDDVANQLETVGSTEDIKSVDTEVIEEEKVIGIDDVVNELDTEMVEDKVTGVDDVANQLDTVGTSEDLKSVDTQIVEEEKVTGNDDVAIQLDTEMVEEEKVTGVDDMANHLEPVEVVAGEKENDDVANQLHTVGTNEEFQVIGEKVSGIDDVANHLEAAEVAVEKEKDEVADKQLETVEVAGEKEDDDLKGVGREVIEEEKVSGTADVASQLETVEIAGEKEKVSGTDDVAVAGVNEEGNKAVGTEVVVEKEGQQQVRNESSLGSNGGKKRDRSNEVDVAMEEVMVPKMEDYDEAVERRHEDEEEEGVIRTMQNQKSFLLDPNVAIGYESGTEDDQATFMKELITFHRQRFLEFKPPKFYGEPLNCLKLWRSVVRLGGYEQVTSCKYWRQVGESFRPPKTCTTVSWTFRCFYEKALLEYEKYKSSIGELPFTDVSSSVPISAVKQTSINQTPGSGRARRDSAARAMQGWHSHRNGEVGDPLIKDKTSSTTVKREKQGIGLLKRKKPSPVERAVKVARMKSLKSQLDSAVVDIGPPADWVKVNVQRTKDCFEVYALVPGLLREEVRVQSDPAGRLVISGQPEQLDNPWGVSPFKKVVSLPSRIDPHQTSAVVTLHGQLFVRVPFEQPSM